MSLHFEELDYRPTPFGALSLRRRLEPKLGVDVFEIKLGEDFLMSSLFTASEIALADLALAGHPGQALDVVVGGLGLGYTAHAALRLGIPSLICTMEMKRPEVMLRLIAAESAPSASTPGGATSSSPSMRSWQRSMPRTSTRA